MSDKAYAQRLAHALEKTGLVVPVQSSFQMNQITVRFRVHKGSEGAWQKVLEQVHRAMKKEERYAHAWSTHSCKEHFLMESEGKDKFGFIWHITIISGQIQDALNYISAAIRGEQVKSQGLKGEVSEMTFTGMDPAYQRNAPDSKGKGVYTIGGKDDYKWTGGRR